MLIFQKKDNSSKTINFLRNKLLRISFRKRSFLYVFFILSTGILLTIPLDYGRGRSVFIDRTRKVVSLSLGAINPKYKVINDEVYLYGNNLLGISKKYIRAFFKKEDEININLNFRNYEKLKFLRNKAVKEGILTRSENDEASGFLNYKGQNYPIKIRLKGDWTDHLLGDKWSFRLKTKNNKAFLGMENFSLQHPRTRNYINEFVYHNLLRYEKLPFLRYSFLPLYLNGKYLGIYALEEHFGKHLLENSGYREGPIIKISDKDLRNNFQLINTLVRDNGLENSKNFVDSDLNNAEISSFNINKLIKNEKKVSQYILAETLMDKFLRKELKTSEVFDLEKTAKFYAISDLMQALPSWYDIRFYFDPLKGRLVPIGYDAGPDIRTTNRNLAIDNNTLKLFDDPEFIKLYFSYLEKLVSPDYLNKFLISISKDINKQILNINKSYPYVTFLKSELEKNKKYIISRLNSKEPFYIKKDSEIDINTPSLNIFNKTYFPIQIIELKYKNNIYIPETNSVLKGRDKFKRITANNIIFRPKDKSIKIKKGFDENYTISYRYDGGSKVFNLPLKNFPIKDFNLYTNSLIKKINNLDDFPLLINDHKNKLVTLKNDLIINKPLILPKGYKLLINEGLKIDLKNEGMILVQGPIVINGKADSPVLINSIEGGKGIFVSDSELNSNINYTIFNNLQAPSEKSLNITGGVTFYNSSVSILNSKFLNSNSEDSLNLIRSTFKLKDSYFYSIKSDAIDADFSNGEIHNTDFKEIGNDAIDISGGKVYLKNISVNFAGDKAVSSGENSEVIVNGIKVSNTFIGIASKDFSKVQVNNLNTDEVKYCFAAYQKKPEYGPSLIVYRDNNFFCKSNYILEKGSFINSKYYKFLPNITDAFLNLY